MNLVLVSKGKRTKDYISYFLLKYFKILCFWAGIYGLVSSQFAEIDFFGDIAKIRIAGCLPQLFLLLLPYLGKLGKV